MGVSARSCTLPVGKAAGTQAGIGAAERDDPVQPGLAELQQGDPGAEGESAVARSICNAVDDGEQSILPHERGATGAAEGACSPIAGLDVDRISSPSPRRPRVRSKPAPRS